MTCLLYTSYGDSFEDIGEAMASITQNLGDLDDASLQNVTESAFALRDTFGYEIPAVSYTHLDVYKRQGRFFFYCRE